VFFKGLVTVLVIDFLFVVLSVPLILRKVPRNAIYGFRTCATLADDFVWYEANAYFGRRLVAFSVISAAAVLMLYSTDGFSSRLFFGSTFAAMLLPSLAAMLLTLRFTRSLTPGGPANRHTATVPR
jgi:hypothetical protein